MFEELDVAILACRVQAKTPAPGCLGRHWGAPVEAGVLSAQLARAAVVEQGTVGGAVLGAQHVQAQQQVVVLPAKGLEPFVLNAPQAVLAVAPGAAVGGGCFVGGLQQDLASVLALLAAPGGAQGVPVGVEVAGALVLAGFGLDVVLPAAALAQPCVKLPAQQGGLV